MFEELDCSQTRMGRLILRKRQATSGQEVYEVTLDRQLLMSSLVNRSEKALAELPLNLLAGRDCDVLVGGLGLGHTAAAALDFDHVRSVTVVDALQQVIQWHEQGLTPLGSQLAGDSRCKFIHADFFAWITRQSPEMTVFDAILVDIDNSPREYLDPSHASFYTPEGLKSIASLLAPGGIFALWSAEPTDEPFLATLAEVFDSPTAESIRFFNPLFSQEEENTIYIARKQSPAE